MKVCVNGYGTIGKRVADAVAAHPKMQLVGISKYTPDNHARVAEKLGYGIYVPAEKKADFEKKGIKVKGTVEEMINASDIVVDASADGKGAANRMLYEKLGKPAIFQGGEDGAIGKSFNARSNFDSVKGEKFIRVVSCNTTSFCRVLKPLQEKFKIKRVNGFLIRRGADPDDVKGSQLNSIDWKASSHHAHDVNTIISVPMTSMAFKAPHTLAHVNSLYMHFDGEPSREEIIKVLKAENRIIVAKADSTSQIIEVARDLGLKRYDLYMPVVISNSVMAEGNTVFFSIVVPQESVVVAENIDAIVAQGGLMGKEESMHTTEKILCMDRIKKDVETVLS